MRRRLKPRLDKRSLPPQTEENNVISTADLIQPAHHPGFVCVDAVSTADLIQPAHHPGFVRVDAVSTAQSSQSVSKLGEVITKTSLVPTPSDSGLIGVVK